ncbi:sphingolipid transporter [Aureococcus anophagefferens]|nr:sphingolipid transporter [Aureococcus anophagefferens]
MAPAPRYSWFVLLILGLIYMQQQWSRYSLNYLYNVSADDDFTSIQAADSLSYADYGILTGYGFSATFCLAGLVAGRAADVSSRKLIIFAGCLIWNAALFMIGYSKTYAEVLLWRLALGFGQAFSNPASYSLIADYFPEAQRAQANGLFACGAGYLPTFYGVVFPGYDDEYSYINAYVVATGGFLSARPAPARGPRRAGPRGQAPNRARAPRRLVVATMQSALEPDCRALAIACFTLIATFFGSLASYAIGAAPGGARASQPAPRARAIARPKPGRGGGGPADRGGRAGVVYDALLAGGAADAVVKWLVLWSVVASYASSGALFLYCATLDQGAPRAALEKKPSWRGAARNHAGVARALQACVFGRDARSPARNRAEMSATRTRPESPAGEI